MSATRALKEKKKETKKKKVTGRGMRNEMQKDRITKEQRY